MEFNLTFGSVEKPQRLLIYGSEGIGKTTFASQMPDPVFIDVEQGTLQLQVARLEEPKNWQTLLDEVEFIKSSVAEASTIVIDTVDAAERLCQEWVCNKHGKTGIEDFGYGKGYVYAKDEFNKLLDALDGAIELGLNVVLVSHMQIRKFEKPDEMGAFDRYELKLNKHIAALVKEWSDAVLFCDYETYVMRDETTGRGKASGGKRVIHTDHQPTWDAKNRWGLPEKLALDTEGIAQVRAHMPARKANPKPVSSNPQPKPSTNEVEAPKKPKAKKGAKEKSNLEKAKESARRWESLEPRFNGLKELMQKDGVTMRDLEEIMAAQGKRDIDNRLEDWEQPFVLWTCDQWSAVVELVRKRDHIKREQQLMAAAEDVPF